MKARDTSRARAEQKAPDAMEVVLAAGGEVGRLIASTDWSATPLGPIEGWKQSLRSAVSICLSSRFPIVMYWGSELTVIYNDAYSEILGAKHPWALGKPCAVCWAEIWDTIGPMLGEVVSTGVATWSDDLELHLERHGAPEESYFSFSFSPVRVEDGSIGGVFTAVVETTRRVLSDRRLRVLTQLGERAGAAHDAGEAAAKCAEAMAGTRAIPFALVYLSDERGESHLTASTGLDPRCEAASGPWPFAEVALSGVAATVELDPGKLVPVDGWAHGVAPSIAMVSPITSGDSARPRGFLVTATNPLRPLDADYRSFFDLVARQVSSSIAHAEAYSAEARRAEALAELDRAKTEFFSNVSHEFRTPLTLMLGPLESLLAQAEPGSQAAADLDMARRNALRLLKLVNTLLDFARIESARHEARLEPVDLGTFTADLASMFSAAVERAGLELIVECAPLPRPVHVDPDMWEKVVLNLLSNAVKFTLNGEIRVAVADVDGSAVLTVADTGMGIRDEDLPRVFDRFYRARESSSRTDEGAGIGLALVKELVEIMGGNIAVASRPSHGTTFTVTLPYAGAGESGTRVPPSRSHSLYAAEAMGWVGVDGVSPDRNGGGREGKILVVDDNADMRAYLATALNGGWEVETVADGAAALEVLAQRRPDLVLTDVMMPRIGGFELLDAIRAKEEWRDIPVVILSARAGEEESADGLDKGADDYLVKPFTVRELRARVASNVRLARIRADLTRSRAQLDLALERASFLNMAAHELRTPLTVIGGYVDLILGGALEAGGPEARAALEKVAYKTREGVRLVEQMLTAARMESGAIEVTTAPTDLRDVARDATDRALPLATLESSRIQLELPDRPVLAEVDVSLVGLILDNLLANAVFHGAGPITVEVEATPPRIRVADSGSGISAGARTRIFEPFYQVEGRLRARGGAGLGLAVSRRLAELHGGSLILEETVGGASFVLTLPAVIPATGLTIDRSAQPA